VRVKKPRLLSGISCLCTLAFLALALSADAQTTAGNELTWMGGCDRLNQSGVYGVQGVPTVANLPGGRSAALTWTDSKGNVLLFGGCGYTAAGVQDGLNDLWKFTPATGQWTWMSGSSSWGNIPTGGPAGVYGTLGTPSASNVHGARTGAVGWTDKNDNLWLGGEDSRRCLPPTFSRGFGECKTVTSLVVMNEDQDRTRIGHRPLNFAVLRHLAINAMQKRDQEAPCAESSNAPVGMMAISAAYRSYLEMRLPC
jgi:hypothetical protein